MAPDLIQPRTRRSLLTAALGGLAGYVAAALGRPPAAAAAAGDPLIMGSTANSAGTANTSLTTNSSGTALLVTQNGSGTALRGSAVGAGSIAGFFTAANGPGISGVTGVGSSYGVYGGNDGPAGTAGAIRANGGNNHGLVATSANAAAYAVKAIATGTAIHAESTAGENATAAVFGVATPGSATGDLSGVVGIAGDTTGFSAGTVGISYDQEGAGVYGLADGVGAAGVWGSDSTGTGVFGDTNSGVGAGGYAALSGVGLLGYSNLGTGVAGESNSGYGVYGYSQSSDAGHFDGSLYATSASASVKAFRIDHPGDPANQFLVHACVESSDRLTLYAGTVTTDAQGEATVDLPVWFDLLNHEVRYQLTPIGDARTWVSRKLAGGRFGVATSVPNTEVCWQLSAVRRDPYASAHPLVVEVEKQGRERGRYLNPVEHGQPERLAMTYELRHQQPRLLANARRPPAWTLPK